MAGNDQLKSLVDRMPNADGGGKYTSSIDAEKIEKVIALIHGGGRDNILGLIDMLGEPGSEADVKPHYALHCLANHVLIARNEPGRRQFCEVLTGQLATDRPSHVKAYLCQELGWAGRREAIPALGKLLINEQLSGPASSALMAIREGATAEFRAAWPKATGAARRHIMDGLAALPEESSSKIFSQGLRDKDREVRIAATTGLAALGNEEFADLLTEVADSAACWERIQATNNCLTLAESLAARGKKDAARAIYQHLGKTRNDASEQHIREAARRGLAGIA